MLLGALNPFELAFGQDAAGLYALAIWFHTRHSITSFVLCQAPFLMQRINRYTQ